MYKSIKKTSLLCLILSANNAVADLKVRVVTMDKIMVSDASKSAKDKLEKMDATLKKELEALDKDLEKQAKALQAKSKVAGLEALEKDQDKFNDSKKKRDLAFSSAQEKIQRAVASEMKKLSSQAQEAATKLLKKEGLDLILTETGAVIAHSDKADITDKLISEMQSGQAPKTKKK